MLLAKHLVAKAPSVTAFLCASAQLEVGHGNDIPSSVAATSTSSTFTRLWTAASSPPLSVEKSADRARNLASHLTVCSRMAFFFSKRKVRPVEGEAAGELNIVPYLDILMNLILFILLSLTGLATFGVVNASAQSSPTPGPEVAADEALRLTVAVSARGFFVASWEGVGGTDGTPNVPALADGSPDYGGLTGKLAEVKRAFPHATKLVLAAEADVPFDVLVATMDAVREVPGQGLLFPDITLGAF